MGALLKPRAISKVCVSFEDGFSINLFPRDLSMQLTFDLEVLGAQKIGVGPYIIKVTPDLSEFHKMLEESLLILQELRETTNIEGKENPFDKSYFFLVDKMREVRQILREVEG
jgi:hypothetical protein